MAPKLTAGRLTPWQLTPACHSWQPLLQSSMVQGQTPCGEGTSISYSKLQLGRDRSNPRRDKYRKNNIYPSPNPPCSLSQERRADFSDKGAWEKELGCGTGDPFPAHCQSCLPAESVHAAQLLSPPPGKGQCPPARSKPGGLPPPLPTCTQAWGVAGTFWLLAGRGLLCCFLERCPTASTRCRNVRKSDCGHGCEPRSPVQLCQ